jgi:catecholate siderophore receptor
MPRVPRHKHHSRRSRRHLGTVGAFVASAAFVPLVSAPVSGAELERRLQSLRIAVPAETHDLLAHASQAPTDDERLLRFDIPAGPLGAVVAEIQRISGLTIAITNEAIAEIGSPGVSGVLTPMQAVARALAGTSVTSRITAPNSVSLEIRLASEAVDVTGVIPHARPSSPKYVRPLVEVPQTIEVIPRAVMEAQGVTTLSDALRNVPGISLQAGEGGGASNTSGDMFNLRGFSANNSLFVDGVRDDGLMSRDIFNLEQVEVFMGPAGADVGRGNAAGYVNMQTKTPQAESAYAVAYAYGSGDQIRTTVDVNHELPLGAPDNWLGRTAVRLNALWDDGGVPGRDIVTRKNQSIAPSIGLGLNTPTRVTAAAQVTRQDNVPDYGIPGAAWTETQLAPTTVFAAAPVDLHNYYGSVGYDFDKVEQESYTGRVEHDLNANFTLRNQIRYNRTHREAVITTIQNVAAFASDTQTVNLARQGNERENTIVSNQTSVVARFGTSRVRHDASAGVEIATEEQFAPALGGVGVRNPANIYHPNPFDPVTDYNPVRALASSRGKTNSVGVYAFDTIDMGAKWQLSGGLRWEHYDAVFEAADAAGATTTDLVASDGLISGKAGVLYRLTDGANVYLSYGSTVTPPGTANFTLSAQPNNQNNPNVRPQESRNYELGTKLGFFQNRLSVSAAAFRTDNENVIFTVDAAAIPPVFNQDDEQRVKGATIGALGQITPRWQMLASLGYLDAQQISQNHTNNGRRLTLTPEWSGSLWTTYDFPRGLTLGGGVRFMDDVFINAANTIRSPGYSLVDAMVEYDVNSHLSLRVNINNITDKLYIRNVNNNGGRFNPGTPRAAMLTSSVRF